MEHIGAVSEGEWTSLSGMYTAEEVDFMAQLLANCPSMGVPEAFWPGQSTMNMSGNYEGSDYSAETDNLHNISQGSNCSGYSNRIFFPTSSNESCYLSEPLPMLVTDNSNISMSIAFDAGDGIRNPNSFLVEGDDQCLNQETSEGNAEDSGGNRPEAYKDKSTNPPNSSMKRSQSSENVQMNKRNTRSKKNLQIKISNNEEDGIAGVTRQSSSSCCSGDESNIVSHSHRNSQELSGGVGTSTSSLSPKEDPALNLSGKSRARRGSATDPQSLYARKRREKINEKLRVLQSLVPNGTKVDISTMLEEAVHYVKFLQLQIKLLSSDDMWMYAPICYNGMELGLDLKLTPPKQS